MFNDKLSFLSNNVNRIKAFEKRLKLFEYFRNLITPAGFCVSPRNTLLGRFRKKWNGVMVKWYFFHTVKQILVESP